MKCVFCPDSVSAICDIWRFCNLSTTRQAPILLSHPSLFKLISNWRLQIFDPSPNILFKTFHIIELSCFIVIYLSYHFEKRLSMSMTHPASSLKLNCKLSQLTDLNVIYRHCYAICYAQL